MATGWVMAFVAYPRLPREIALWPGMTGWEAIVTKKSLLYFLHPGAQTLFTIAVMGFFRYGLFKILQRQSGSATDRNEKASSLLGLEKEFLMLALIFFNLIFIHIQTTAVLLSHGKAGGLNKSYFFTILAVLLMLIPYYRFRRTLLIKKSRELVSRR
jgi:uncharacterized membrane protein